VCFNEHFYIYILYMEETNWTNDFVHTIVKLTLCLIKHHTMNTHGRVDVSGQLHAPAALPPSMTGEIKDHAARNVEKSCANPNRQLIRTYVSFRCVAVRCRVASKVRGTFWHVYHYPLRNMFPYTTLKLEYSIHIIETLIIQWNLPKITHKTCTRIRHTACRK
jgi:hypothetical protein